MAEINKQIFSVQSVLALCLVDLTNFLEECPNAYVKTSLKLVVRALSYLNKYQDEQI